MKSEDNIIKHIFSENLCIFCGILNVPINVDKKCKHPSVITTISLKKVRLLCENGYKLKFVVPSYKFEYEHGDTTLYYILTN